MAVIDLEGCSLLQPGTNKGPILGAYFPDKQSLYRLARRRGTGRLPGPANFSNLRLDSGCHAPGIP